MRTADRTVAAIVLAAGQGTRFAAQAAGGHKLLAAFEGAPLVRHVVAAAIASRARPVIVVTGHQREAVREALSDLAFSETFNARYASGMASSLQAGLGALPTKTDAAIVLLADMPRVSPLLIDRLLDAFVDNPRVDALIPVHAGRRGNPVLLARRFFATISTLTGDEGARKILNASSRVVEIDLDDDAIAFDVDTPDKLLDGR